jgi:CCR4-NOT complex subunit CAF16
MINAVPGVDEARKQRLIKVLDIDPEWRMHQVSDGQRRRVQICVGLLRPFKVNAQTPNETSDLLLYCSLLTA